MKDGKEDIRTVFSVFNRNDAERAARDGAKEELRGRSFMNYESKSAANLIRGAVDFPVNVFIDADYSGSELLVSLITTDNSQAIVKVKITLTEAPSMTTPTNSQKKAVDISTKREEPKDWFGQIDFGDGGTTNRQAANE